MSTSTTNLHLTKPAASEHADIAIINANYDLIDEFAGTVVVDPDYVHTENNYTTTEKQKLEGLENYTLPTASSSTKGGVKVDNESISIDQSGTISAALSGLNEVNIDTVTLSDGQILKYDATSGKWINASGGSGGSGHTILDDDGTALAQEDDLQFKGVYSADNSTDGVTEVHVYREMTRSEFNALSSDEKKGFIRTTDEPDIYSDGHFQPVIYSTEERKIGVWTDGKPLYEKTFVMTGSYSITSTAWLSIVEMPGVDTVIDVESISPSAVNDGRLRWRYLSSNNYLECAGDTNLTLQTPIITVRYTKTTDTAGSGTWTPQGVPTVHYSTDEHIVGTWIDGKTLYKKTVSFTTGSAGSYNTYDTGILNPDTIIFDFNASYYETGNAKVQALSYWGEIPSSGYSNAFCILANKVDNKIRIDYRVGSTASNKTAYVTVRYTKSS